MIRSKIIQGYLMSHVFMACVITTVILLAALSGAQPSSAHLRWGQKNVWAFAPYTRDSNNTHRVDPLTYIFQGGGGIYSGGTVVQKLQSEWSGPADMTESGDLCRTHQGLGLKNERGRVAAFDPQEDLNYHAEQVRHCGVQYHTRLWNDYEHSQLFPAHTLHSWYVGTIHREKRASAQEYRAEKASEPGAHIRLESFEKASRVIEGTFSFRYCTVRKWRYLPGSEGRQEDMKYSDGYLKRIDLSRGHRTNWNYSNDCAQNPG